MSCRIIDLLNIFREKSPGSADFCDANQRKTLRGRL